MICYGFLFIFNCQQPAPSPAIVVCPSIRQWNEAFQNKLADELERLPSGAALKQMAREHVQLRDKAQKCRASH